MSINALSNPTIPQYQAEPSVITITPADFKASSELLKVVAEDTTTISMDDSVEATTTYAPANGLAANGLAANGLAANGLAANGLAANGLAANGLAANGLAANGLEANGFSNEEALPEADIQEEASSDITVFTPATNKPAAVWEGSDYNPSRGQNDGEGGPPDKADNNVE
jgi:hypothetical protein